MARRSSRSAGKGRSRFFTYSAIAARRSDERFSPSTQTARILTPFGSISGCSLLRSDKSSAERGLQVVKKAMTRGFPFDSSVERVVPERSARLMTRTRSPTLVCSIACASTAAGEVAGNRTARAATNNRVDDPSRKSIAIIYSGRRF